MEVERLGREKTPLGLPIRSCLLLAYSGRWQTDERPTHKVGYGALKARAMKPRPARSPGSKPSTYMGCRQDAPRFRQTRVRCRLECQRSPSFISSNDRAWSQSTRPAALA